MTMNFLHILANIDAYQACLLDTEEEPPRVSSSVRFADGEDTQKSLNGEAKQKEQNNTGLRPTSVQSVNETTHHLTEFRPKSGKSLTFHLGPDRRTPVSNAEFKQRTRREVKTPLSARKVTSSKHGPASGRETALSSIREGARTPTPNATEDMNHQFLDVQPDRSGLTIWRIQGSSLKQIEEAEYGFFHEGNSSIVLNISRQMERTLHFWIGNLCSESEASFAEEKAHELDKIIGSAHVFSKEEQSNESVIFQKLFPDGIIYIEGKHKMSVSKAASYDKKMYVISGRKYARAECVHPTKDHLKSTSVVILDSFPRVYIWIGKQTGYVLRNKAIRIARKIQQKQRRGKCHIVVIDENDGTLSEAFKKKFDEPIILNKPAQDQGNDASSVTSQYDEIQLILYRISGDRVLYDMPEATRQPLHHYYLTKRDCFLLDRGANNTVYIWVGSEAVEDNVARALTRAKSLVLHKQYNTKVPICRIQENHEPSEFKQCFCDWRDHLSKEMSLTKRYSAGNIGRALFSRTDNRTIATLQECWSEDTLGDIRKNTQVWVVNSGKLEPWDHVGLFTNNKCFLVLYTTIEMSHYQHVIYYWMGSKSTREDQQLIVQLASEKDDELENRAILIRVLDHKEPQHFLTALRNWMIVYDGDVVINENSTKMFCVRDFAERATRIHQVIPEWQSLNSSASFMILTQSDAYLWYGKFSGSTEREAAKDLIGILCSSKMYSYEIAVEGKESSTVSAILGAKADYAETFKEPALERRTPALVHCDLDNQIYTRIENFQQEDLSEEDVYILDCYDQVFVWCGERTGNGIRRKLSELANDYIDKDPAGRDFNLVSVWIISQRSEPLAFSKHFSSWNALGYAGRHSYEVMRKRIRQENAKIDINENMVDTSFLTQPKYPYKVLLKQELPPDVDDTKKHQHLSDKQFQLHLKISRLDFYRLPLWKQNHILRSAKLLYKPSLTTKPFDQPLTLSHIC